MGVIISRYLDPRSSEGALIRFAMDSARLVHTVCTAEAHFPELTPWNVIDFNTGDFIRSLSSLSCWPRQYMVSFSSASNPSSSSSSNHPTTPNFSSLQHFLTTQQQQQQQQQTPPITLPPPFSVEYDNCSEAAATVTMTATDLSFNPSHLRSHSSPTTSIPSPLPSSSDNSVFSMNPTAQSAVSMSQPMNEASQWLLGNTL